MNHIKIHQAMTQIFPNYHRSSAPLLSEYQAEGVIGVFTWDKDDHTADFILLDEEKSIPQEYWKPTLNCRALMHYALTHTLPSFKRLGKVEVEETTDGKKETFWQAWYAFPTENNEWLFWCGEGAGDGYSIEERHRASITITDSLKDACYDANLSREDVDPWVWSHLPPPEENDLCCCLGDCPDEIPF